MMGTNYPRAPAFVCNDFHLKPSISLCESTLVHTDAHGRNVKQYAVVKSEAGSGTKTYIVSSLDYFCTWRWHTIYSLSVTLSLSLS